jgi:alkyldihydroxyacetonephosphate synthase
MSLRIDRPSLLVFAPGTATLHEIERALGAEGLTLGFAATDDTIASFLARGAPGAPSSFADPADHLVAGLAATLKNGQRLEVHPAPRRAVGPDLAGLVFGCGERFASIDHVWLRVHLRDARAVTLPTTGLDLDPPLSRDEATLLDAIARELGS